MKTFILTGCTGAIGRAACAALAHRGNLRLVLLGRKAAAMHELAAGLQGPSMRVDVFEADLSDVSSVRTVVAQLRKSCSRIDGLVHIAAVYKGKKTLTAQNYESTFATNHLGPFLLTTGLLDLLKKTPSARVITVTAPSTSHIDFDNLNGEKKFSGLKAFTSSKMMNLLMAFGLSAAFKDSGQASLAFHPGLVRSELLREGPVLLRRLIRFIASTAEKTGEAIAELLHLPDSAALNGKFFNKELRELQAAPHAYDRVLQHRLWTISEELGKG
jgi:retinol dehydrogenase 14